jgi:adenylate kinase
MYGHGERTFYEHFRKAWTGIPVPVLGEGNNIIPTIHVSDVAKLIKKMILDVPIPKIPQYLLAVDPVK